MSTKHFPGQASCRLDVAMIAPPQCKLWSAVGRRFARLLTALFCPPRDCGSASQFPALLGRLAGGAQSSQYHGVRVFLFAFHVGRIAMLTLACLCAVNVIDVISARRARAPLHLRCYQLSRGDARSGARLSCTLRSTAKGNVRVLALLSGLVGH